MRWFARSKTFYPRQWWGLERLTRSMGSHSVPRFCTSHHQRSLLPRTIRDWNKLDPEDFSGSDRTKSWATLKHLLTTSGTCNPLFVTNGGLQDFRPRSVISRRVLPAIKKEVLWNERSSVSSATRVWNSAITTIGFARILWLFVRILLMARNKKWRRVFFAF